jgi:hypothetical protein
MEAAPASTTFQCSPALHRRDGETCLPPNSLEELRRVWNKTHPRHKINADKTGTTRKKGRSAAGKLSNTKNLFRQMRNAMKSHYKCDTEYCMVKKLMPAKKQLLKEYFRPEKPEEWDNKPTTWLDSFNIEDVMDQYEKAVPEFEFIGPVPIDFDAKSGAWGKCIVDELCKLDLNNMNGKKKVGIIFNLDPHDEPGSHWVCAFIDIPGKSAYYFDSYGIEPPAEVARLLKRCKEQGIEHVYYNDIRHQRKGSECGMYCLFVLICLLRGRPFYNISKNIVDDDTMNAFRDVLFAEEKPRREAIEKALPTLCT